MYVPRMISPITAFTIVSLYLLASAPPAHGKLCKTWWTNNKFESNTNVTVTSGTDTCIEVDTPIPIAVGNQDGKVKYKLCCVANVTDCSSLITVAGTGTDGKAKDYTLTRKCRNCNIGRDALGDPDPHIGDECESDDCICNATEDDLCIYTDDGACDPNPSVCVTCAREVPLLSNWGFPVICILSFAAGTIIIVRRRQTAILPR